MSGSHRLRRSLLFVPGGDARKLEKAARAGADTLVLDLEDAVVLAQKEGARAAIAAWLRDRAGFAGEVAVRVNAPGTPWFEGDLAAVVGGGADAMMLPKSETSAGLGRAVAALERAEHDAGREPEVRVLALVESAAGIAGARDIAGTPRVDALCFGHADFSLDMGLPAPDPAHGVLYHARCALAIAARAAGVAPIDTVCLDVRDEASFRRDAEEAFALGFDGKLCIHPAQVMLANAIWTPSPAQVAAARRVVAGWREAQASGRGVFALDGKMVDGPVVAAHERVLERARRAGVLEET